MEGGKSESYAEQSDKELKGHEYPYLFGSDSDMPKAPERHPSEFSLFVTDFKKKFRAKNSPNTPFVLELFSPARAEWDTMSDADKAPYVEKTEKSKEAYYKLCADYWDRMDAYHNNKRAAAKKVDKEHSEEAHNNLAGLTICQ